MLQPCYKLLICAKSFIDSFRFSTYTTLSSANKDSFTTSFPICILFTFFYCFIALARASSMMLERSGEKGHTCLITDLSRKAFSFSPLSITSVVLCRYTLYIYTRYTLYIYTRKRLVKSINIWPFIPNLQRIFIINGC
uniref:Uncharacterized protein n=1 Tax=Myotis myotis TaxID=51298 RepID=A0A7J8AMB6_MYOMY|nr:hypothetical protein mMyoMyo1_007897 [Myotis myotis]